MPFDEKCGCGAFEVFREKRSFAAARSTARTGSTISTTCPGTFRYALQLTAFDEKGCMILWRLFPPCHSEEDGTSDVRISFFVETNGAPDRETPTVGHAPSLGVTERDDGLCWHTAHWRATRRGSRCGIFMEKKRFFVKSGIIPRKRRSPRWDVLMYFPFGRASARQ